METFNLKIWMMARSREQQSVLTPPHLLFAPGARGDRALVLAAVHASQGRALAHADSSAIAGHLGRVPRSSVRCL